MDTAPLVLADVGESRTREQSIQPGRGEHRVSCGIGNDPLMLHRVSSSRSSLDITSQINWRLSQPA